MTYEKFEHKVLEMLLEGNDPRLEKLLVQTWDKEVVSRKETETGFVVQFLVPPILAIDEKEGRILGVEIRHLEQPLLDLELIIKDGLINSLEATYTTQTTYAEVVSRYNELTFVFSNETASDVNFHSDHHDPNEVTFVKNIATISKEIDANISRRVYGRKSSEDSEEMEELDAIIEPFIEEDTVDVTTEIISGNKEEKEALSTFHDEADHKQVKKPSRLALKVEELKRAALEAETLKQQLEETQETEMPLEKELVQEELAIKTDEANMYHVDHMDNVDQKESVYISYENIEPVEIVEETLSEKPLIEVDNFEHADDEISSEDLAEMPQVEVSEKQHEFVVEPTTMEELEEPSKTPEDIDTNLDQVPSQSYIEALEQELSRKMDTDQLPLVEPEETKVEEVPITTKSYIEELEESILKKLEAEDPTFVRRGFLPSSMPVEEIEPELVEDEEVVSTLKTQVSTIEEATPVEDVESGIVPTDLTEMIGSTETTVDLEDPIEKVGLELTHEKKQEIETPFLDDKIETEQIISQGTEEKPPSGAASSEQELKEELDRKIREQVEKEIATALAKSEKLLTKPKQQPIEKPLPEAIIVDDRISDKVDDALIDSEAIVNTKKVEAGGVKSLRPVVDQTAKPDQAPSKKMNLGEYMKHSQQDQMDSGDVVVQEEIQAMIQNLDVGVTQSVDAREKMSIGTKVGIFLIILGIIVLIIWILTRPT